MVRIIDKKNIVHSLVITADHDEIQKNKPTLPRQQQKTVQQNNLLTA